jgi:hypothetical protein
VLENDIEPGQGAADFAEVQQRDLASERAFWQRADWGLRPATVEIATHVLRGRHSPAVNDIFGSSDRRGAR